MQKMIEQAPEVYKKWKKSGRIEEWITPFGTLQILKPAFPSWCELDWPKLRYRRPEDNKRGQPIKI